MSKQFSGQMRFGGAKNWAGPGGFLLILVGLAACADHALAPNHKPILEAGFEMTVAEIVGGVPTRGERLTADALVVTEGMEPKITNLTIEPMELDGRPVPSWGGDKIPALAGLEGPERTVEVLHDEAGTRLEHVRYGLGGGGSFILSRDDQLEMITNLIYTPDGRVTGYTNTIYVDANTTHVVTLTLDEPSLLSRIGAAFGNACAALGPQPLMAANGCLLELGDLVGQTVTAVSGAAGLLICKGHGQCAVAAGFIVGGGIQWLMDIIRFTDCAFIEENESSVQTRVKNYRASDSCTLFIIEIYIPGFGWVAAEARYVGECGL